MRFVSRNIKAANDTIEDPRGASTFDTPLFLYYSAQVIEKKEKVIHTVPYA